MLLQRSLLKSRATLYPIKNKKMDDLETCANEREWIALGLYFLSFSEFKKTKHLKLKEYSMLHLKVLRMQGECFNFGLAS